MSAYSFATINSLAFVAYSGARIVRDRCYVTGQPSTPAYAAIAAAGIKSRSAGACDERRDQPLVVVRADLSSTSPQGRHSASSSEATYKGPPIGV